MKAHPACSSLRAGGRTRIKMIVSRRKAAMAENIKHEPSKRVRPSVRFACIFQSLFVQQS